MNEKMHALLGKLSAPLPPEAHEVDDSRGFTLVGIKGAYVIERLNEVFGPCGVGWSFKTTNVDVGERWVVVDLELAYCVDDHWGEPIPVNGSCNIVKGRIGDAKKGAIQDGIKKAASYLGVGQEAYKGLLRAGPRKPAGSAKIQAAARAYDKAPRAERPRSQASGGGAKAEEEAPEQSPQTDKAITEPADWIRGEAGRKRFLEWTRDKLGLSNGDVCEALAIDSLDDYAGAKLDAHTAIMDYITRQVAAAATEKAVRRQEEFED